MVGGWWMGGCLAGLNENITNSSPKWVWLGLGLGKKLQTFHVYIGSISICSTFAEFLPLWPRVFQIIVTSVANWGKISPLCWVVGWMARF